MMKTVNVVVFGNDSIFIFNSLFKIINPVFVSYLLKTIFFYCKATDFTIPMEYFDN